VHKTGHALSRKVSRLVEVLGMGKCLLMKMRSVRLKRLIEMRKQFAEKR